eukprot:scaffold7363_cov263-Pinguiococcus_pyrenoidosus.AAC.10
MSKTEARGPKRKIGRSLSPGILVVGLGGNNGVTMLAGLLAVRQQLSYEAYHGRVEANLGGCISQLASKGLYQGVGFADRYDLAKFEDCAMGGWDIRSTPLGDALYESRVLEYDLTRQVRRRTLSGARLGMA